jgi:hypothetical protein
MFRLRVIQSRPPNFVVSLEEAFSLCFEEAFSDRYLVLTVLYVLYCSLVFINVPASNVRASEQPSDVAQSNLPFS